MAVTDWLLDTNVLISAALSNKGAPHALVQRILSQGCLVFSSATFEELRSRLYRPKFDVYLSLDMREGLLHDFSASARWIEPDLVLPYSRDPSDDVFIATAVKAGLPFLVSGDKDLLEAPLPAGLQVLTPTQALSART
ncbi:MAG: putative toxin-antitoxin system toxin component, PIN family [Betaproteobacteria bacterium]|nr:putative toxin-antitoxin system toxin component, PIN family [Betaproteobacteria bacterium]